MSRGACVIIATLLALALPAFAQEECMDCMERWVMREDGVVVSDAMCCDANCFGGYEIKDSDVGWGCRTAGIPPGTTVMVGNEIHSIVGTQCASQAVANACGDLGEGGGSGGGGGGGGDDNQDTGGAEPLILDLNGDGIWTTRLEESPVWFDLTGNGAADLTAWTAPQTEDAFLYFDLNRNRQIDGGQELFGDATLLPGGRSAKTGYEALAAYDAGHNGGSGDGVISPADGVWGKLRLWVDRNHDGRMTRDEDFSLASRGVVEISLAYLRLGASFQFGVDAAGNFHFLQGTFKQRVTTPNGPEIVERRAHDVWFRAVIH